jgi:thioredoxin 1
MSGAIDVSADRWDEIVAGAELPVVVDFWAPWCGPCRMVGPEIDKLTQTHGDRALFVKVNIDEEQELAMRFGVMSIPTIGKFVGGELVSQVVGARGAAQLAAELGL